MTLSFTGVPAVNQATTPPAGPGPAASIASWNQFAMSDDAVLTPGRGIRSAAVTLPDIPAQRSLAAPPGAGGGAAGASGGVPGAAVAAGQAHLLAQHIGTAAARQAKLQPSDYTKTALSALGEQVLLDHAQQPGGRVNVVLGVAAAHANNGAAGPAQADLDKRIAQAAATLANQYKTEVAVLNGIYDLAELKMPSRRELAGTVLEKAGLSPKRLVNPDLTELLPGVRNAVKQLRKVLRLSLWETASQFYFDADRLTDADINRMKDKPLGAAELQQVRSKLPVSLADKFDSEFATFVDDYARIGTQLLGAWIPGAAAQHGIDIANAQVTVTRAHAQHYIKDTRVLPYEGPRDIGEPRQELTGHGYLVTIGTGQQARRLFLSALDGQAHPLPAGVTLRQWVQGNTSLVFGDDMTEATAQAPHYKWRMAVEEVGHGRSADMSDWLNKGLRAEMDKHRDEARGQNWDESVADFLLNLIPLRATIVALKKGDYLQALSSASMDAMVVLPLLAGGVRAASLAVRAAVPMMRAGALEAGAGAIRASAIAEDISAALAAGMRREIAEAPGSVVNAMGPLDLERMAGTLVADHPQLAADLESAAGEVRGASVSGKWRPVEPAAGGAPADDAASRLSTVMPRDELSAASEAQQFINDEGEKLDFLPYGGEAGLYTQVSAEGEAEGMLLMADASGAAHPVLPLTTFERYRVDADWMRNATLVRANSAEGTVVSANRHYVALGEHYIEVVPDRSLSSGRTIWRVKTPRGTRPDPVLHRLVYDRDASVWRRPNPEEMGLPGGGGISSRHGAAAIERNAIELGEMAPSSTAEFREILARGAGANTTQQQMTALKSVLLRMESNPKGAAIMRALRAYHARTGQMPEIVLRNGTSAEAAARPSLAGRTRTFTWNLDLAALEQASAQEAADELTAVYNNMTGFLEPGYRYIPAADEKPFGAPLETAWSQWLDAESDKSPHEMWDTASHRYVAGPSRRTQVINQLRAQLQELRAHGGVTAAALRQSVRADTNAQAQALLQRGAFVKLSNMNFRHGLPPIPNDVLSLDLSGSFVGDWSGLPTKLVELNAMSTGMTELPRNLPGTITRLDLTLNNFKRLDLWEGLESVRLYNTKVGRPLVLPNSLLDLDAPLCKIEKITWRSGSKLRSINIERSAVKSLKSRLPEHLDNLNLGYTELASLPDLLRTNLKHLNLMGLNMSKLPPLTRALRTLDLTHVYSRMAASPFRITPDVMELVDCVIDLNMTFVTEADIPPRLPGRAGPTFLHAYDVAVGRVLGGGGAAQLVEQVAPPIEAVLAPWFMGDGAAVNTGGESYADILARWQTIADAEKEGREFKEFRIFVRRLAGTVNALDETHGAAFRKEVRDWLAECSKTNRVELRQNSFAVCLEANDTCQDRISWVFSQLKSMRLNADIASGLYDDRVADVVAAAREAFAKEAIEEIATNKADAIEKESKRIAELESGVGAYYPPPKRLDIYFAYLVKLGERAGVTTTGSRNMRFFEVAGVSEGEINAAWPELNARLRSTEFETYLSRKYYPWESFLKRNFKQEFAEVETKLQNTLEDELDRRLHLEIKAMKGNPADPRRKLLEDDVIVTRGPVIRDEIQDQALQALTRRFLRTHKLEHLLEPGAQFAAPPASGASGASGASATAGAASSVAAPAESAAVPTTP